MADPVFQNEPLPAQPPKKRMSNGVKIAIGCGVLLLLAGGSCGGAMLYCGKSISDMGSAEWRDLRAVANDLGTDAGAQAAYASHPGLSQAYPTAEDFVGAARLWRRDLEPLPAERPPMLSGKVGMSVNDTNGISKVVVRYNLSAGKVLVGTWVNHKLSDLQLE
jgi:hypothetical protein